jgi:hypothetical protein
VPRIADPAWSMVERGVPEAGKAMETVESAEAIK